jgi:hypothetical protein
VACVQCRSTPLSRAAVATVTCADTAPLYGPRHPGRVSRWKRLEPAPYELGERHLGPARRVGRDACERRCVAFNPTDWYAFSDHSPVVATFED